MKDERKEGKSELEPYQVFSMRFSVEESRKLEVDKAGHDDVEEAKTIKLQAEDVKVTLVGDVASLSEFSPGDSVVLTVTSTQTRFEESESS